MSSVASDSIDAEAAGIDIGGDMGRDSSKYGTTTGDLHEADSRDAGVFGAGSDTKDFSGKLEKPSDQETGNATSDGSGSCSEDDQASSTRAAQGYSNTNDMNPEIGA